MKEISPWSIRSVAESEDSGRPSRHAFHQDEVHLTEYWNILVKRRLLICVIFLAVSCAGAYFALSATELYTASATVKIEPQNPRVTGVGELQPLELRGDYDYYQTQFVLLRSRPVAARVITDLDLDSNKSFTSSRVLSPNPLDHAKSWLFRILRSLSYVASLVSSEPATKESPTINSASNSASLELTVSPGLINQYLGFIGIAPVRNTRLVSVQFTTPDPDLSQALANAHVQTFMRMSLENRFTLTKEAREFLDEKKTELKEKLEKSEIALNDFRRARGVISVEKGENIVVDRLVDLNKQLTAARAQRIEAESLFRTVENKDYQDLAEVMRQGLVQQLKGNVATLEAEKARLGTVFKPDHPRIQELTQQIAAARQALNNEIANVVRGIQSSYVAARAREGGLQAETEKQQRDALKLKELGADYTILQEEVNANRSLYQNVLKRLSETNVSNDIAVSNMEIVESAAKPFSPSAPNVPLYLMASMVSGLFLGIGAAFLKEFLDRSVSTPDDVWRSVGLSTLGVVPDVNCFSRRKYAAALMHYFSRARESAGSSTRPRSPAKELTVSHSPLSIFVESYRMIRTSLLLSQPEKPPQVVLLTSPSPGEGKTVTSLNLAIALAQDGHSVLLVDGDMRKGCCHNRLGLCNNNGLSNVLTGHLALEQGIQQTQLENVSLLSRGILPPNPNELLGSPKMREILRELRQTFNFILIDSPPVVAVSDAVVLSVMSDGVVLVFDGQKTQTPSAQKAVERLDMVRARLLGVILNAVDLGNPHYSHYREYSSYYGALNGDEPTDKVNGNGHHAVGHNFYKLSKFAKLWNLTEHLRSKDIMEATIRNVEEVRPTGGESAAIVITGGESNEAARTESIETSLTDAQAPSLEEAERSPITQVFLNQLLEALSNAIGPIAPLVVRDQIAILGESESAFPKSRIGELVNLIQGEIDELKLGFRITILQESGNVEIKRASTANKKRPN